MRTIRLTVRGRVQGVGFRAFVIDAAVRHGVRGWVRNEPDGSVEIAAQGEIKEFLEEVRQGPRWARVDAVETLETDEERHREFRVRY